MVDTSKNPSDAILARYTCISFERLRVSVHAVDGMLEKGTGLQWSAELSPKDVAGDESEKR